MLDLASSQVSQGKAAVIEATQGASKTFNSASAQVMVSCASVREKFVTKIVRQDAVNKKEEAMTYWNTIVSTCSNSAAAAAVKRKAYKKLSKMYEKIHRRMRSFKVE
eukprot:655496-Hanusia_phi.AAC.2